MKTRFTDLHARTAWDYSWFHLLLKILLHNQAPPPPPPINRVSGSASESDDDVWKAGINL